MSEVIGAHLELLTLFKGKTGFTMFGAPAALLGVAHDGVGVALRVKARVEVKSDCVGVMTDVDGKPEHREKKVGDTRRQFLCIK